MLRGLVAATQQQQDSSIQTCEIQAVTRATMHAQFEQAFAKENTVSPVPIANPSNPNFDVGSP